MAVDGVIAQTRIDHSTEQPNLSIVVIGSQLSVGFKAGYSRD